MRCNNVAYKIVLCKYATIIYLIKFMPFEISYTCYEKLYASIMLECHSILLHEWKSNSLNKVIEMSTLVNDCSKYFTIMDILFPRGFERSVQVHCVHCRIASVIRCQWSKANNTWMHTFSIERRLENVQCCTHSLFVNTHSQMYCLFTATRNSII